MESKANTDFLRLLTQPQKPPLLGDESPLGQGLADRTASAEVAELGSALPSLWCAPLISPLNWTTTDISIWNYPSGARVRVRARVRARAR